jgi:hypothetical protein
MPDPTDFVTDLPADFEIFGDAVDASFAADEGDLLVGGTSNIFEALPIGAAGTVLTSDGDTAEWVAPAVAGGKNFTLLNAGGTTLNGTSTVTISGISGADQVFVIIRGATAAAFNNISMRVNADTGSNYNLDGMNVSATTTYARTIFQAKAQASESSFVLGVMGTSTSGVLNGVVNLFGCNSSGVKIAQVQTGMSQPNDSNQFVNAGGFYSGSSTISSVTIFSSNFTGGTVFVYTSA